MKPKLSIAAVIVVCVLGLRLLTLGAYPLPDTTEARYGEMSRLMESSGNWVTPQIRVDEPFWGKPPLTFWASAAVMRIAGPTEFAARVPSFAFFLGTLWLVARVARIRGEKQSATMSVLVASTSLLGFLAAGSIWTDVSLLFATTLIYAGIWFAVAKNRPSWRYAPFIGGGLTMLAKGPVGLVIVGIATVAWCTWDGRWRQLFQRLPWSRGLLLMACIFVPWYALAERATPGFLDYFLIGEHVERFLVAGWEGDLYGAGHAEPRGSIWLQGLVALSPWSFIAIYLLVKNQKNRLPGSAPFSSGAKLALCWVLAPFILFSLATNILPTYVLPALPALAVLTSLLTHHRTASAAPLILQRSMVVASAIVPALFIGALAAVWTNLFELKSQKYLLEIAETNTREVRANVCYPAGAPYSANFYSRSTVISGPDCDSELIIGQPADLDRWDVDWRLKSSILGAHRNHLLIERTTESSR